MSEEGQSTPKPRTVPKCAHTQIELRDIPPRGDEKGRRAWLCRTGCGAEFIVETEDVKELDVTNARLRNELQEAQDEADRVTQEIQHEREDLAVACVQHGDNVPFKTFCAQCFIHDAELRVIGASLDATLLNLYQMALRSLSPDTARNIDVVSKATRELFRKARMEAE